MKWVIFLIILCTAAFASDIRAGQTNLLALTENGTAQTGSVATLNLEIIPGKERVFLETFPMTKIATQASLRFAQQVACKELDIDCSHLDFLFTIQALPGIVGGPSAGSAATFLTSALLLNKSVPADIAMTGTINSGGIVGIVGGVKEKIEAASQQGIRRVFVPKGTSPMKISNKTVSITEYGMSLNLSVVEVSTLAELLEQGLGVPQNFSDAPLKIDPKYQETMEQVATDLCGRTKTLTGKVKNVSLAKNYTARADKAQEQSEWYAAASYCFRANVELKEEMYREQGLRAKDALAKAAFVRKEAEDLRDGVEARNVTTITDLQTQMAVLERIEESLQAVERVEKLNSSERLEEEVIGDIVYGEERLFSAVTWSRFFNGMDQQVVVDPERLKQGCAAKLQEAEERYNYVKSIIPEALDGTRNDIDRSYGLLAQKKYGLCLHLASKAKAEADVLMAALGVSELDEAVQIKLRVARTALMRAQQKGIFPIIAYSYYEYANSLQDFDKVSAILFAGYALELANVDMYFEPRSSPPAKVTEQPSLPDIPNYLSSPRLGPFLLGIAAGMLVVFVLVRPKRQPQLELTKKRRYK